MSTQLVLDALEQAIWTRHRAGADLGSVVAHSDRGSQYVSIRHTERLVQAGAVVQYAAVVRSSGPMDTAGVARALRSDERVLEFALEPRGS